MRISRIFVALPLAPGVLVSLPANTSHYLAHVLRLMPADPLILFNDEGREFSASIADISKKQVRVQILEEGQAGTESPLHTHLALGISRGERMDYAIQKSTELGVSEITPLFTEHGEVKLSSERSAKRQAHWQQIAISACEQSGRVSVPVIHAPLGLERWLPALNGGTRLLFHHHQEQTLPKVRPAGPIILLIGPEGGFSAAELALARQADFVTVRLGPRVLRTETAPVVALSVLQYRWGDLFPSAQE
ncbi:MAG: 16S rRNA (uracil(1498)-N(3))-methyltransferase [Pseudomonadales bacterium]|nr:16S rRNA (uracil(1498)-N(3))-methyltransferase [Pseudomonadales bacterium]